MDPASALLRATANSLAYRAQNAFAAASNPRRSIRARALAPGSFDAEWATTIAHLVEDHGLRGWRLAQFLRMRRHLDDAPMPRASRLAAAQWTLAVANELVNTRGLAAALGGSEVEWRAFVLPLERARDMRLQIGLVAALTQLVPQFPDARAGPRPRQ